MSWQPIETAPKGTRNDEILLYCPRRGVVPGWWNNNRYAKKPKPYWSNAKEHLYGVIATREDQPTHWQPLPEPPK